MFSNSLQKSVSCHSKRSCPPCMPVNWHLEFRPEPRRLATPTHPWMLRHQPNDLHPLQHPHQVHQSHHQYQQLNVLHLHQPHWRMTTTMKSHQYTHSPELKMQCMPHQPPTMSVRNRSHHHGRSQTYHLEQPPQSTTHKWLQLCMHVLWIHRSPSHSANSFHCRRRSGIKCAK